MKFPWAYPSRFSDAARNLSPSDAERTPSDLAYIAKWIGLGALGAAFATALLAKGCSAGELPSRPRQLLSSGYFAFCYRDHPELCTAIGREPQSAKIDPLLLSRINAEVNSSIRYREDPHDHWAIAPASGDCDDFAVTKLFRLLVAGVPRTALRLAWATVEGRDHLLLLAFTTRGILRLDSQPLHAEIFALETEIAGHPSLTKWTLQ